MTATAAGQGLQSLSKDELAILVPEYQMAGHMLDRGGTPHASPADLAHLLAVHPSLGPVQYTGIRLEMTDGWPTLRIPASSAAMTDGANLSTLDVDHLEPLDALIRELDVHLRSVATWDDDELVVTFHRVEQEAPESGDVALVGISTGATHIFEGRTPLPLLPSRR
ncbi:MAG TPA: hypothetical protein VGL26_04765 [Jatrophihabitans sp.]|jgi:hypothetical protein